MVSLARRGTDEGSPCTHGKLSGVAESVAILGYIYGYGGSMAGGKFDEIGMDWEFDVSPGELTGAVAEKQSLLLDVQRVADELAEILEKNKYYERQLQFGALSALSEKLERIIRRYS